MALSGKARRLKGRQYQAELAKRWRDLGLWPDAHSTHGSQARAIGKEPSDIGGTPYVVEAKRCKTLSVHAAMAQAERAAEASKDERTPIVVWRRDGSSEADALVVMRLGDFEELHLAQREGWEAA